jgi:hypothetical protein
MIPPGVLEAKQLLGQEVHEAIAASEQGVDISLTDRAAPYYDSYLRWRKLMRQPFFAQELRLYHEALKITGCIDALGEVNEGQQMIYDFKCSYSVSEPSWRIQGALYKIIAESNGFKINDHVLFIKLNKNGGMPLICDYLLGRKEFDVAYAAIRAYEWFKGREMPEEKVLNLMDIL